MTDSRSEATRRELGDFLRTRRERISPDQAGVPSTGRRRTPGLRREEVAALAGVGVTWYTWLEQGRSINASAQVLMALCRTLRLDDTERRHVQQLAGLPIEAANRTSVDPGLTTAIQPVLDKLDPFPACVQTRLFDVIAYNRAYRFLLGDIDQLSVPDRNCAVKFFTDSSWRERYVDHNIVAARMVARLRAVIGGNVDDPAATALVRHLLDASPEFAELWSRHDVMLHRYEIKRIRHPEVGLLQLSFVWTTLDDGGHRMSVMTPADEVTSQRLQQLAELTAEIPAVELHRAS